MLHLTYRENATYFTTTIPKGWWADANYNTDTYDRIRSGSVLIKETLTAFRFLVGDDGGFFILAADKPFDIHKPILWNTGSGSAGYVTSNVYVAYSSVYLRYQVPGFTGVQGASCYLVGTLSGSTFMPAATYLTCTAPTAEDSLTYLLLGCMSNTTNMTLYPEHPMFRFVDGAFQPLSQVGFEAFAEVGALRTETQTAIAQTNAAIAFNADQTTTDALSTRIDQAEQKITPEAIASTVTSAALFAYE